MRSRPNEVYLVRAPGGVYRSPGAPGGKGLPRGYTDDPGLAERYTEAGAAWLAGPGEQVVHERDAEVDR